MQTGEILESRYQLQRQLQTSWLAVDLTGGRQCLLKPKSGFYDPGVAEWLGEVRHHGLPRLLGEITSTNDESFWIFEYINGQSFREMADKTGGRMRAVQLLPWALQAARILAFIHLQNDQTILHLDIKPENLVIADDGQVSLIDFGAAQRTEITKPAAHASLIALTPDYAAPELLAGHPCAASDLYSFGLTMLHLMSSQSPVECRSRPLPDILSTVPDMPDGLQRLIGRCLHTEPDIRLNNAAELVRDLSIIFNQKAFDLPPDPLDQQPSSVIPQPAPLLCIWDGAEFGCELAAVIAEQKRVLVIDADLLNPQADLLLGLDQDQSSLNRVMTEDLCGRLDVSALNHLTMETRVNQVRLLANQCEMDQYEYFHLDSLNQVLKQARLVSDVVIVLCSQFVFDAFTCYCLQMADLVLIPLEGDIGSFRRYNRAAEFLNVRQQLDPNKLRYVAFHYRPKADLSWGTMDELCGGRLIGCVSDRDRRRRLKSGATPYAATLDRSSRQEYLSIIRKINLPNFRKKVNN